MMKKVLLFLLCGWFAWSGCKQHTVQQTEHPSPVAQDKKQVLRYGMMTGVKPDKLDHYKQLHAKPWPAVLSKIKECHIENYSIFLQKVEDKYYLFSYFEYTGSDFDADMKKMAADTTTQRWWRETDPCQLPLPEAVAKKQIWIKMDEVFHTN